MREDIKEAIDHITTIMVGGLVKRRDEGIELERHERNFWSKLKKRIPEEVAKAMEEKPEEEASQQKFQEALAEQMNAQNVKMSVVAFLFNKGIEL